MILAFKVTVRLFFQKVPEMQSARFIGCKPAIEVLKEVDTSLEVLTNRGS